MKRLFYFLCVNFIFFTSSAQTTQFVISTTTTTNANEYQWNILDSDSTTVLFSSTVFSDSTMVNDTVTLNDCSDYYFVTSSNDTANSTWSSGSSVYVIELASSDTIIQTVGTTPPFIQTVFAAQCNLIINEIHYDNIGTDTLEGVEIVGKAGYDLSCYTLYLYNGSTGLVYDSLNLSGVIPNDSCGYGAIWFAISGIQNGDVSSGDGIGLANSCKKYKIQFLSYEGSFIANNGLFDSEVAMDIGVSESAMTPVNTSIQLVGFGEEYSSFVWVASLPNTRNMVNTGQSFCLPDLELVDVVLDSVCDALNPVNNRFILTNVGTVPFNNFLVSYSINGGTTVSELVADTLMPADTLNYSFVTSEDFSNAVGDYSITSWCSLNRDSNSSNDSLSKIINFIDIVAYDTTVCYGDSLLLSPTVSNATNYIWSTGDTTLSISLLPSSTSSYTLIASNACFSDTAIINVIVSNPTLDLGSDLVLCGNDTITLDATANFSSYAWSSGDSLQLTSIIQGGAYSVVVTDSLGCSTSDTISIFHSIPQADLGADLNICGLDSIVLGVSSFSSYSWSNGDTSQNSAVTQVGTYTVSVVDSVGCPDSDTIVIFESATSVDLGPNVVALCGSNDTITLDATSIYSSYSWSTGDTLQSLAVYQVGNYNVTVTDSLGCTASDSIEVIVSNPTLNLGSDTSLCNYTSLSITAPANFSSYIWSNSDTTQTITATQDGAYSLIVTDNYGCQAFDTIVISYNGPSLDLGPDVIVCEGDYHTFFVHDNYSIYQWSQGGSLNYITEKTAGEYWLKVTASDGCTSIDTVKLSTKDCTSLEEAKDIQKLKIFPNPNNGTFNLSLNNFSEEKGSFEIVNTLGERVYVQDLEFNESISQNFELNSLPKGIYFLNVKTESKYLVERLIIQ
ncbi:MAG: T9SS type A sorting domain-containing protein [Flavobacteriales bacterium]|nr:T9SS type A sorting domain-containing protein [Flavobacteriales bacterium]